ncbi:concanavalin A-like lectin/glucanase domain-containing protein [Massariosphaeria phaeospora]|uniref:Concanavalin A-like lectin/glucanase domain-containing protein n=1 Tax=Massariosphaeria phaeospora TaxID=100035 RepID=A0A7C8ME00_9PLEO|nr:concanavalin A-like lectin/glucanase domain-containing protein [Massariosphaeria phaeospora]
MRTPTLSTALAAVFAVSGTLSTAHDAPAPAPYTLTDDLSYENFFANFELFSGPDPTKGFVSYQNLTAAIDQQLIGYLDDTQSVYMGVDFANKTPGGRPSVRLESTKSWNHGLLLADIKHMPDSTCGTWPAFWLLGAKDEWPQGGEIDVLEGVNDYENNAVTLHTGADCVVDNSTMGSAQASADGVDAGFSGFLVTDDCDVNAADQSKNKGCSIAAPAHAPGSSNSSTSSSSSTPSSLATYGTAFNAAGGGIYALEWLPTSIIVWFIPSSSSSTTNPLYTSLLTTSSPDPSTFGVPIARFQGHGCDMAAKFRDLKIVFDTTFCGEWAGQEWDKSCKAKTGVSTCEAYVRENPEVFESAFWEVGALKWFQRGRGRDRDRERERGRRVRGLRRGGGGRIGEGSG